MKLLTHIKSRLSAKMHGDHFFRNVLIMFTGSAVGQLGSVLLSPVLTRIYSPYMFGVLGTFTAAVGILSVLSSLRFEMGLPLLKSDRDAADLLAVCMTSLAITFLLFVAVIGGMPHAGGEKLLGALYPYRWLMPVGFACIGAYQVMIAFATRQHAFDVIARTKVYQGAAGPSTQILLGLCGSEIWGLITGYIVGQSMGVSLLFSRLVAAPGMLREASLAGMRAMARRFRRFFLISSWAGILDATGGTYLLLLMIPLLYSSAIAGFVFLTDRIIGRPLLLISTSILQVYVGDVSRSLGVDPAAVKRRFLQMAKQQLCIVSVWLAIVNILAPYAVPLLFGREWQGAVPYLHVLSIAYLPQMVMHAMTHTLQIMERQGMSAVWQVSRLVAVLGVFAGSYAFGFDALHALLGYSMVQAASYGVLFLLMYGSIQSIQDKDGK